MINNSKYFVRVNGRGNAWPIPLGETHDFYDINNIADLANASFSILKYKNEDFSQKNIEWEILIDAGHGVVQYLLQNSNRIPEAIFITHPHIDHTLGIDWIVQSHFRKHSKKYPVYASAYCWEIVKQSFPHLIDMVEFKELSYGNEIVLYDEIKCTAFPSYHGQQAFGASMLSFKLNNKKLLYTGDIILPMLRKKDVEAYKNVDLLIADANNRFPYPKSNHWSVCAELKFDFESSYFLNWLEKITSTFLIIPHIHQGTSNESIEYLNNWLIDYKMNDLPKSIFEFAEILNARNIWLVHYSGKEDFKYHQQAIMNDEDLTNWCNKNRPRSLPDGIFRAPKVGDKYAI